MEHWATPPCLSGRPVRKEPTSYQDRLIVGNKHKKEIVKGGEGEHRVPVTKVKPSREGRGSI